MKTFWAQPRYVYLIAVLLLWANFSSHILSTLSLEKYLDGEFPSESFVFSRLVYDLEHGTQAHGGLMLKYNHVGPLYKSVDMNDYAVFKKQLEAGQDEVHIYPSHAGLQDDLVFPIWQGLDWVTTKVLEVARPDSRWDVRLRTVNYYYYNLVSQTLVALVNALVISGFVFWAARQFAPLCGWLALAAIILLMPVLGFYGRSLWWMEWSWFLPTILVLYGMRTKEGWGKAPSFLRTCVLAALAGAAVCMKVLMGYEFVPPVMVGAIIPVTFYAIYRQWGMFAWLRATFIIGLGCLIGAAVAMYVHYDTLTAAGMDAMEIMKGRYQLRAYGGETMTSHVGELWRSTQSSVWGVIGGYFISPKELSIPQIILMAPFLLWCVRYFKEGRTQCSVALRRLYDSFVAVIALGVIGGIAMLVILKGHAYIHGYDIAIWAIPTNIFLFIFYAIRIIGLDKNPDLLVEDRA